MSLYGTRTAKILRAVIPFIIVPSVILGGYYAFGAKAYSYITFALLILSLLLFFLVVEKRKIGTRRSVVVAVMTALAVAGRLIFKVIPGFTPITAMAVISGMYLGPESGFLVGALSALLSNFYAGQGPWTPFQMFAWGIVGLLGGIIAPLLKKHKLCCVIYAIFAGILYSLILDIWTVLWYGEGFSVAAYLAAIATALPSTAMYCLSNIIFLLLCVGPFGTKLERIRLKYGI